MIRRRGRVPIITPVPSSRPLKIGPVQEHAADDDGGNTTRVRDVCERIPKPKRVARGFLVVTPGVTIRDRLRVLQFNDPDSYYASRELVPNDMLRDLERAKIVVTNYHAFLRRETLPLSKGGRALLQWPGPELRTKETEGQMLQRVMPGLMGMKRILALNDEAHHCYREKPAGEDEEGPFKGDDRKEAERNREAARVWTAGLEAVQRKLGLQRVIDLSVTPFFLRGSGYREGTLFPWTASDFSLMDAIESGIVKLPRVPVADNIPGGEMPKFRNLWEHIRSEDAEAGSRQGGRTRRRSWSTTSSPVPPARTRTAPPKLVNGRLPLFRNFDEHGNRLACPHTLLIDSEQLDSGEALYENFRAVAGDEIERFRREANPTNRRPQGGRASFRPGSAPRGDEHRREAGHAGGIDPLRRLRLDAHRGLRRPDRHARAGGPRLRDVAPLRAGHRPRAAPPVVRPQRRWPLRCRPPRFRRAAGRRPRRQGPAPPRGRGEGLPGRGRQGQEVDDGHYGCRASTTSAPTVVGPSPSSPTSTRWRRTSRTR